MRSLVADAIRKRKSELEHEARGFAAGVQSKAARARRRAYSQGAMIDRLSSDWRLSNASPNLEIRADMRELRRRARSLRRDDPYVRKAVNEYVQNIVGEDGLRLHPKNTGADGNLAEKANNSLKKSFADWSHKENASIDKKSSWTDIQAQFIENLVVDGEVFLRMHGGFRNPYGFATELIDPDYLDEQYNRGEDASGSTIVMGIEFDKWGAPAFYHFWTRHPSDYGMRERIAVPADEIIHIFKPNKAKQARGMTWLATIIFRLHMMGAYEDAEVTSARFGASSMGFLTTTGDNEAGYTPSEPGERPEIPLEPGTFPILPPGMQVQSWDPQHPNSNYAGFVKSVLRSIACGLGMAYTTLSGDLEAVNYSSIRTGLQSERDFWRGMQKWMAENVHRVVFGRWLAMAVLTPKLNLPSMDAERWKDVQWRGRGWSAVDPYNEARANEMSVGLGLTSRTRLCSAMGVDFEEILQELAQEKELGERYDVFIDGVAAKAATAQPVDGTADTPTPEGGDKSGAPARELQLLHVQRLHSGPEPEEMRA